MAKKQEYVDRFEEIHDKLIKKSSLHVTVTVSAKDLIDYVKGTNYNLWDGDEVAKFLERLGTRQVIFGREYSPVLYFECKKEDFEVWKKDIMALQPDEVFAFESKGEMWNSNNEAFESFPANGVEFVKVRLWWD